MRHESIRTKEEKSARQEKNVSAYTKKTGVMSVTKARIRNRCLLVLLPLCQGFIVNPPALIVDTSYFSPSTSLLGDLEYESTDVLTVEGDRPVGLDAMQGLSSFMRMALDGELLSMLGYPSPTPSSPPPLPGHASPTASPSVPNATEALKDLNARMNRVESLQTNLVASIETMAAIYRRLTCTIFMMSVLTLVVFTRKLCWDRRHVETALVVNPEPLKSPETVIVNEMVKRP